MGAPRPVVLPKYVMTVRMPIGVAGLIIAANTPIANVAWKVFPALICGNAAVLKCAEDTPATAWIVGQIARDCGLPPGVLNIIQGFGEEAGAPLVAHPNVGVISFTGSTEVGRIIQRVAGERFCRVSLELGGRMPSLSAMMPTSTMRHGGCCSRPSQTRGSAAPRQAG